MKAEILLAGYHAKDQERPISVAAGNTITFEYYDDNARDDALFPSTDYLNNTQVVYSLVGGETRAQGQALPQGRHAGRARRTTPRSWRPTSPR